MASYALALGQARMKADNKPVSVMFATTNGFEWMFTAFQLNSLEFGEKKNLFWHSGKKMLLAEECDYKVGRPSLEGYNPEVFQTLAAMYMQGIKMK